MGLRRDLRRRSFQPRTSCCEAASLLSVVCHLLRIPSRCLPVLSSLSLLLSHSRTTASFLSRPACKQISAVAVYLLTRQDAPHQVALRLSQSSHGCRGWKMAYATLPWPKSSTCPSATSGSQSGVRSRVCSGHVRYSVTPEGNADSVSMLCLNCGRILGKKLTQGFGEHTDSEPKCKLQNMY